MNINFLNTSSDSILKALEKIAQKANLDHRVYHYIIVPDQISSDLLENITIFSSKKGFVNLNIYSFPRIAQSILKDTFNDKILIKELEYELIIRKILLENNENLTIFKSKYDNNLFIDDIKRVLTDLSDHNLAMDIFRNINVKDSNTKNKLNDLTLIINSINNEITTGITSSKLLNVATENISLWKEYFNKRMLNVEVHILGFDILLNNQLHFIESLIKNGINVDFGIIKYSDSNIVLNKNIIKTENNIINILKKYNITPKISYDSYTNVNFIVDFSQYLYSPTNSLINKVCDNINNRLEINVADNVEDELDFICNRISTLVKNDKLSFNDIVVYCGCIADIEDKINKYFTNYGIPFYLDYQKSLNTNPLSKLIIAIRENIYNHNKTKSVIGLIKFGYFDSNLTVARLENLILKNSKTYFKTFENDEFKPQLSLITCILKNINNIKNAKSVATILDNLIGIFDSLNLKEKIDTASKELNNMGKERLAQQYSQLYDFTMDIIESMRTIFSNYTVQFELIFKILLNALENIKLPTIPQNVNNVLIALPSHSQFVRKKVGFTLATNKDKFIKDADSETIFTKMEMNLLIENNIPFTSLNLDFNDIRKANFVSSLSKIQDKLIISYSKHELDGSKIYQDMIVDRSIDIFNGNYTPNKIKKNYSIYQNLEDVFKHIATKSNDETLYRNLLNLLIENNKWAYEAKTMLNILDRKSTDIIRDKINKPMVISVSQIEKYNSCPFAYFSTYELKLREREEYTITSLDIGNIRHFLLENFFREYIGINPLQIKKNEIEAKLKSILASQRDYLYRINDNTSRFIVESTIKGVNTSIQFMIDDMIKNNFIIEYIEKEFNDKLNLMGNDIIIKGKIDRIDKRLDNVSRIIDYKSSSKTFDEKEIKNGLMLQLPFYAYNYNLHSNNTKILNYINVSESQINANSDTKYFEEIEKMYNGSILYSMDDFETNFLYKNKIGKTKDDFNNILQESYDFTCNTVKKIIDGDIKIHPYKNSQRSACNYCPYSNLCGFDSKSSNYKYKDINKEG